jgi:hypothetical protein
MAKTNHRTVINRQALTALRAGFVDGMERFGQEIIARTNPPDDPATAKKIKGDWGVWSDGRKVAGTAAKPRGASVKQGVTLLAGFEFPARLQETGSVHQPARPFFSPEINGITEEIPGFMKAGVNAKGIR